MDKRKMIIPILAAGVMALVLAVGAFTHHSVSAQATNPTPSTPSDEAAPVPGTTERGPKGRGIKDGATQQDLADALGVDLATLQAAQQAAAEKALAEAVSQGLITQEQADQLKERGLTGRGLRGPWLKDGSIDTEALLAEALGISVDELETAKQAAMETALARAVENGTITQEQADLMRGRQALANNDAFQSAMQSAFESAVQQAVADGVITQAQADLILQESAGKWMGGRGFGGLHGFGGRHGRGGGLLPAPDTQPDAGVTPEGGL